MRLKFYKFHCRSGNVSSQKLSADQIIRSRSIVKFYTARNEVQKIVEGIFDINIFDSYTSVGRKYNRELNQISRLGFNCFLPINILLGQIFAQDAYSQEVAWSGRIGGGCIGGT